MPEATTAPDALCCPISMEIMRDPAIAADGHTYERAEIESWFANKPGRRRATGAACVPPERKAPSRRGRACYAIDARPPPLGVTKHIHYTPISPATFTPTAAPPSTS